MTSAKLATKHVGKLPINKALIYAVKQVEAMTLRFGAKIRKATNQEGIISELKISVAQTKINQEIT